MKSLRDYHEMLTHEYRGIIHFLELIFEHELQKNDHIFRLFHKVTEFSKILKAEITAFENFETELTDENTDFWDKLILDSERIRENMQDLIAHELES